jgi:hypothetical protein
MPTTPQRLLPVTEELAGELAEKSYVERTPDFVLLLPIGTKRSAAYVFEQNKATNEKECVAYIQQSCNKRKWTRPRARLVEISKEHIARERPSFIATHFVFHKGEDVHVISQIADICLADIIEAFEMTEDHASAILTQVSSHNSP